MDVKLPQVGNVFWHTCHCVQNEDKATDVIVCGGQDWDLALKPIFSSFRLGNGDRLSFSGALLIIIWYLVDELYARIEREIQETPVCPPPRLSSEEVERMQLELEHLRQRCAQEKKLNNCSIQYSNRIWILDKNWCQLN